VTPRDQPHRHQERQRYHDDGDEPDKGLGVHGLADGNPSKRQQEIERLRRFLTRIASPDELVGLGVLEPILADPTGLAERELKARMAMAQRGLDGDEYP